MNYCKVYKEDLEILRRAEESGKRAKKWIVIFYNRKIFTYH
jgi:hypothetical protein